MNRRTPPKYELRPACTADKEALFRLHVAAFRRSVEATWGWDEAFQRDYFEKRFDPTLRTVVLVGGRIAGELTVEREEDHIFLSRIALLPDFQQRGLGTALIKEVLAQAGDLPVILHVLKANPAARRLYERLGFEVTTDMDLRYVMTRFPGGK